MNTEKLLKKYVLVSVGIPFALYCVAEFGNDFVKGVIALCLFILAVFICIATVKFVNISFADMDNVVVDTEFIVILNIALIILFSARYILTSLFTNFLWISRPLVPIYASPLFLLVLIPFVRNYNLNRKTIYMSVFSIFLNIYIFFPIIIILLNHMWKNEYAVFDAVYASYYGYTTIGTKALMYLRELFEIGFEKNTIVILQSVYSIVMLIIMYVPYLIIDIYFIDKRSYMEKGRYIKIKKFFGIALISVIMVVICIIIRKEADLNLSYGLMHY